MNTTDRVRVLLIEDNPVDIRWVSADFEKRGAGEFILQSVQQLADGIRILENGEADVVLLDLFLEETKGMETLKRVRDVASDVPIVVLTALNDESLAMQA